MKNTVDNTKEPMYIKVYKKLKNDIINGVFEYNSRLPSKRFLAEETGVSIITIGHAYELLCDEGYVYSKERSGYFVNFKETDGFALSEENSNLKIKREYPLIPSYPMFPVSAFSKTVRKILSDYADIIFEKSPNSGRSELRSAIKRYLARNKGINADINQIVIGSGAEYLYRLIVDLLGKDKIYAIEKPSYEKIEQIYRTAGVKYELLPLMDDGIDSKALLKSNANVLHTTPYQSFPSGITALASKRHEYIKWAQKGERFIIESDYGSEFSIASKPTETLFSICENDNVIYMNTFSKTISPAMRIGYMVIPKKLVGLFFDKLGFYSCTVATLEQLILTELINNGDFERHINRIRRNKRKELLSKK